MSMLHIIPPAQQRLVWYLAAEEYLARQHTDDCLMPWIVAPTVIIGRHQIMANEVNLPYCQTHHIDVYRRKSGGGCVYADSGNLMLSFITPDTHTDEVFQRYLDMLASALRQLGLDAVKTEHNDVLINGCKVSGNACYALTDATIVHGTLLWDVDFDVLEQAITPSSAKLNKHGVQSVRQRVSDIRNLSAHTPCFPSGIQSTDTLSRWLMQQWCPSHRPLTEGDIDAIHHIEQTYLEPRFLSDPS